MSMENIPIYLEARKHASLPAKGSNSGLVFEKFFPRKDENHTESFKSWLCNFMKDYSPDPSLLSEYVERQKRLVRRLNGKLFLLGNDNGCFVTGMGRNHPLENGFLWHPILGTPYLPGSSLKGAVRSWMLNDQWKYRDDASEEAKKKLLPVFGSGETGVGSFLFLDLLPVKPPKLKREIMTPHYGPYYQSGEVPGDWHSPTPIEFLAVGEGQSWQTGIIPVRSFDGDTEQLLDSVYEALEVAGLGSKTSVGYGRFNRDIQAEEDMKYHLDELRKQETADKALNQQLQGKSPDLQELIRRSLDEGWIEPGKGFPVKEIEEYLEEKGTLSRDCIEWIVENYISKDLWEHPDAVKKNGKLKYKPNQSQMVVSLKKLLDDC